MFNLSWAEMAVIIVVGLLVLGPNELPTVIRTCKKYIAKLKHIGQQVSSALDEVDEVADLKQHVQKVNEDIQKIVDMDGNVQDAYDITDVMPVIDAEKKKRNEST